MTRTTENIRIRSIAGAAALLALSIPAYSQVVVNGGFEASTAGYCAASWSCSNNYHMTADPASLLGSQIAGTHNTLTASPAGGNMLAAWYIGSVDSISQTITGLTVGQTYDLTFYEADANRSTTSFGAGAMGWQASVGGTVLTTAADRLAIAGPTSATLWSTIDHTFVATATSEVLKFLAQSSVAVAPEPILLLDGVSVTPQVAAVPEPSSYALLLAGVGAISLVARRRRAK